MPVETVLRSPFYSQCEIELCSIAPLVVQWVDEVAIRDTTLQKEVEYRSSRRSRVGGNSHTLLYWVSHIK